MKPIHNYPRRVSSAAKCLLVLPLVAASPVVTHAAGLAGVWGDGGSGQRFIPWNATNLVALAAGSTHNLAVQADGTVVAWGDNTFGQATVPPGLSGVIQVAAGSSHSLALKTNGTLVSWGDNTYGQRNMPAGLSNVTAIVARHDHSLALQADGRVVAWGGNGYGEGSVPAAVSNVVAIAAGLYHNLALRANGTVFAWGFNGFGQTNVPPGLSNVVAVAAGARHSLALRYDGTIASWGDNSFHQATPPPGISNAVAVASGELLHSLALLADGSVIGWGDNYYGESSAPSILSNATAIAAGEFHSMALAPTGPIQVFAVPAAQTLFLGSNAVFTVSATGGPPLTYQWFRNGQPLTNSATVGGVNEAQLTLTNVQFSEQGSYMVTLLNPLGSVSCPAVDLVVLGPPTISQGLTNLTVGAGADLGLVIAAVANPPPVYQWTFNGTNIPGATNNSLSLPNAQASDSGNYTVMISNRYGPVFSTALVTITNDAPYLVGSGITVTGAVGSDWNLLAPLGGHVSFQANVRGSFPLGYIWWFNGVPIRTTPQLNLGAMTFNQGGYYDLIVTNDFGVAVGPKILLTVVPAMTWTPPGDFPPPAGPPPQATNLVAIAAGWAHLVGLRSDGTVSAWSVVPVTPAVTNVPAGLSNVTSIAAYYNYSLAVRRDGTVVGWGGGGFPVPPGLSGVLQAIPSLLGGMALLTNGTVVVWGHEQPQPPPGLSNVVAIASGDYHRMALKSNGTVTVWGQATNLPGLSQAIAIAAGNGICLALKADGTVTGWNSPSATPPRGLSNVLAIASASTRSVALLRNGTLSAWGFPTDRFAGSLSNVVAIAVGYGPDVALFGQAQPAILQQPLPQTVWAGSALHLGVLATGLPPLGYQWFHNGTPLPGAVSPVLTLAAPTRRDSGFYSVIVTNLAGSVLSSNALVDVLVQQLLTGADMQPDGAFTFYAGDADGAPLLPSDLPGFNPQSSTNLIDWTPLTNSLTLSNGVLFIRDVDALSYRTRFYRVLESRP